MPVAWPTWPRMPPKAAGHPDSSGKEGRKEGRKAFARRRSSTSAVGRARWWTWPRRRRDRGSSSSAKASAILSPEAVRIDRPSPAFGTPSGPAFLRIRPICSASDSGEGSSSKITLTDLRAVGRDRHGCVDVVGLDCFGLVEQGVDEGEARDDGLRRVEASELASRLPSGNSS